MRTTVTIEDGHGHGGCKCAHEEGCPHHVHPASVPTIPVECGAKAPEAAAGARTVVSAEAPYTTPERTESMAPTGVMIDGPGDVYTLLAPRLAKELQEVFVVICLSTHSELLGEPIEVARGSRDGVDVDTADIFRGPIERNANAFIVVHNHPAMQGHPSDSDKELTKTIEKATAAAFPGDVAGTAKVPFADHVIISAREDGSGEYSNWRGGWKVVPVRARAKSKSKSSKSSKSSAKRKR